MTGGDRGIYNSQLSPRIDEGLGRDISAFASDNHVFVLS